MGTPIQLPFQPGDVLAGKYRIERVLGRGGMGVVVSAYHLHLDERVAIKILQAEALSEPATVKRFLREGRAAAQIQSEHVARVRDVGTLDDGAPYIVMEYLQGSDLDALVKARGPLPSASAVFYILESCEAIAEAHSLGIVHRDIKPSNLFLASRRDGSATTKVIDFGISKITQGPDAGMDVTKTAEMRGSLLFISPEQMTSPKTADPRSDIWSLGVSLHYLLSGKYPFKATQVPELCALILQSRPTPLRADRSDAPAALEAIVARCLEKNPAQRFQNISQLADALLPFAPEAASVVERIHRLLGQRSSVPSIAADPSKTAGSEAQTAGKSSWASTRGEKGSSAWGFWAAVIAGMLAALGLTAVVLLFISRPEDANISAKSAELTRGSNSIELAPAVGSAVPIEAAPAAASQKVSTAALSSAAPSTSVPATSKTAAILKPSPGPKPLVSATANPVSSAPPKSTKKNAEIF